MPRNNDIIKDKGILKLYEGEFCKRDDKGYLVLYKLALHCPYTIRQLLDLLVMDITSNNSKHTLCLDMLQIGEGTSVKIPDDVKELINVYLSERIRVRRARGMNDDTFGNEPLFLKLSNWDRISVYGFSKAFYRIGKNHSIEGIGIASLRKTYANELVTNSSIYDAAIVFKKSISGMKSYLGYDSEYLNSTYKDINYIKDNNKIRILNQ